MFKPKKRKDVKSQKRLPLLLMLAIFLLLLSGCSNYLNSSLTANTESETAIVERVNSRAVSSSEVDFRRETIYFFIPSRFIDGNTGNNVANEWCSSDPEDLTWRGDFEGLIKYGLDYIDDLGFTAIWMTPIVQGRGPLDYHGYHAWDFEQVDNRLETPGYTYQDVINEAHARGIKVIQDIVLNHSGRYGIKEKAELKYNTDPDASWYAPENPDWEYDGITPNPQDGLIWSRANLATMPAPYNENLSLYNWPGTEAFVDTSDPNWFHHSGNGFAQGWDDTENLYYRALADDCPDLNTESADVRNYLVNAYNRYIDMGVDAFRIDTVKHMDRDSVLYFVDAFLAHDPDLFLFGEVAQKRHELHSVEEINPHWYTWTGQVGASENSNLAILDFYAEATFHNVFEENQDFSNVQAAARYDNLYSDPSSNVMWLDNHDFGPNNDWNRRFSGSAETLASYVNFTWTWRGIPSLYYGSEIQFMRGALTDIDGAQGINESLGSTGRAYYGDEIAAAHNHKLYQHIKKMNAIRAAVEPLQVGDWSWAGNPSNGSGVGYVRENEGQVVCVGLAKNSAVDYHFTDLPSGTYRDAVTGQTAYVESELWFTVEAGSAGIFVLNGSGLIGIMGAGFFQSSSNGFGDGNSEPGYNVSGRITLNNTGLSGITVSASGRSAKTDSNGNYTITDIQNGSYALTPSSNDFSFTPEYITITVNNGAITNQNFIAFEDLNPFNWNECYFRGTPNNWGTTTLTQNNDTGMWETVQTFTETGRFKIDHYGDWTDNFPSEDVLIERAGTYLIEFDDNAMDIKITTCDETYSISGQITENGKGLAEVVVSSGIASATTDASGNYCISGLSTGTYSLTSSLAGHSFSPESLSVTINETDITGQDFLGTVEECGFKWEECYFRGTPNNWESSSLVKNEDSGLWETVQIFNGDNPRFKITHYDNWTEAYPSNDYLVEGGAGNYLIKFNDSTYDILLTKIDTPTYSLSGCITFNGSPLEGVTISAGSYSGTTDSTGNYIISNMNSATYNVTPSLSNYNFIPSSQSITLSSNYTNVDFTSEDFGSNLIIHYQEFETADNYYIHLWDGLDGDIIMNYEGIFNNVHWWTVTLDNVPDNFKFCFKNESGNWDGTNRTFSIQADEIYISSFDSTVHTSRP